MEYISPLRYPGGKGLLSNFLQNVILFNNLEGCDFYEPFAGGAGAALQLMMDGIVNKIFLNDADRSIYAFWNSILRNTDEFIDKIMKAPITIDEWKKQKEVYNSEKKDLLSLGFSAFFLNRCNRSGIIPTGGPIGGRQQNGKWKIDARFIKHKLISRISKIATFSNKINFTNRNAMEILKDISNKKRTFIYIDPPYYKQGSDLYLNAFSDGDHILLSNIIAEVKQKNWILTYDNCDFIKKIYKKNKIEMLTFYLNYSLQDKRKGQELLIYPKQLNLPTQIKINGNLQLFQKISA